MAFGLVVIIDINHTLAKNNKRMILYSASKVGCINVEILTIFLASI
jgi:hypothetical protein